MDLAERIARRRNRRSEDRLVVDWDALDPTVHLPEPIGREALYEAILDAIDPVFDEVLPSNVYVWGPEGSGKSGIVTALISSLRSELTGHQQLFTATRGESESSDFQFVYLDARQSNSQFTIYQGLLDSIRVESVPRRGVGTADLREQLRSELSTREGVLVAVDHLGEPDTIALDELYGFLDHFDRLSWIGVGREPPDRLPLPLPEEQIHVPAYTYELVDILTVRGSRGLSRNLSHTHAQQLTEWADGNAHDALAALYLAATAAEADDEPRLRHDDIIAGIDAVPKHGVPIGRVLARTENEQLVLHRLLDVPRDRDVAITTEAEEIASSSDLTSGTVKRLLYELAQIDILKRVEVTVSGQLVGRQPSMVVPNFSAALFEHLTSR